MCQKNDYSRRIVTVLLAVAAALLAFGATLTSAQIVRQDSAVNRRGFENAFLHDFGSCRKINRLQTAESGSFAERRRLSERAALPAALSLFSTFHGIKVRLTFIRADSVCYLTRFSGSGKSLLAPNGM